MNVLGNIKKGIEFVDYRSRFGDFVLSTPLPKVVVLPLGYGKIKPAVPVVGEGSVVKEGQLVAKPEARESVPVFSSVPGEVKDIRQINMPDGGSHDAIIIELSGAFNRKTHKPDLTSFINMAPEELWKYMYTRGLVRHSQPAMPPYLFMPPPGKKAKTLIVRVFPSQPWDYTESIIFNNMYEQVMVGVHALIRTTMPQRLVFFLEKGSDFEENREKIKRDSADWGIPVEVRAADNLYPAAHDFMLVEQVDGIRLKYGDIPAKKGYVITEPSTLFDIYTIVTTGKPAMEQIVSVGGEAVAKPAVCKIKKGMPVFELMTLKELSLKSGDVDVYWGGIMTGYRAKWLGVPVLSGISALTVSKKVQKYHESACIKCASCSAVCPRGLEPMLLYDFIEAGNSEDAISAGLKYCIECGLCSSVCQSYLPLSQSFSMALREEEANE